MNKKIPILVGILLTIIAVWLLISPSHFQIIDRLNNLAYDLQLRTHALTHHDELGPIVIIDIDDKSLKAEGHWPWPRNKLAELVDKLKEHGVAVIAFDVFFSETDPNEAEILLTQLKQKNLLTPNMEQELRKNMEMFNDDRTFAKSLSETSSVLAIGFLSRPDTDNILPAPLFTLSPADQQQLDLYDAPGYIGNIPILQNAAKLGGFINIFADNDGIIRRAPLVMEYQHNVYPALSLQAVLAFLNQTIQLSTPTYHDEKELEGIYIGNRYIPMDARGQVLIPFVGKSYTFPYYSATDVLHHHIPKNALLGKIAFVGTSATGLGDLKTTAIESPFPGVEIQATLANGMLQNNFSYIPAWTFGANFVLTILLGLTSAFLFPYLGPRTLSVMVVFLPPLLLFINNFIWAETGLILSFLLPVILILIIAIFNIIYGYLFETRKRERLKEMFGQYVPAKHIDEMLHVKSSYALRGEDREMTVLFADIRNFTSISEDLSAKELVEMLNTFLTPMTEIIFKHKGTIDKYVGDLIMAFWGAPLRDKFHARHAISAALDMQDKIKALQPLFTERNWPVIKLGIGINSGEMSVGDMGSRFRRNYTVIGDAVNLASRIESLTKFYGVNIIVTANTANNQTRYVFKKLDRVKVKGKKKGIDIYELVCRQIDITPELKQEIDSYHEALEFYFEQQWEQAEQILLQLSEQHPDTKLYRIYIDRIQEFKHADIPSDWDGIYSHASK